MKISLNYEKSIEENASDLFDKAKKLKSKQEGIEKTILQTQKKIQKLEQEIEIEKVQKEKEEAEATIKRKKKAWYHSFRWFFTSEGHLVIGGRDATTNELVIKKHTDQNDIIFHTDMAGSPFFVLKSNGPATAKSIRETADATATFSKGWQKGLSRQDVFYVTPEQVTKKALPGEYLAKGAFMIYGKTTYVENQMNLSIGLKDGFVMAGPHDAIKTHCEKIIDLKQGEIKASDMAKVLSKLLEHKDVDELIRVLPAGGFAVK